jgi:hypothetical protein
MTEAETQGSSQPRMSRERSTIRFPYDDLSAAEEIVRAVHERYGGQANYDQIAAELGVSSTSGAFRNKVSAARMFGFVTVDRQGAVTPTPLGTRLLDERTARDARAHSFLNVPLYAQLHERYRGATLPNDKGLEEAIRELGVAAKQVTTARQAFQRSAQRAGYFHQGRNRLVKPPPSGMVGETGYPDERTDERREEGQPGMQADPLLASLFQKLPSKDEGFSKSQRDNFVTALKAIFTLVYGPEDEERKDGRTGSQPTGAGRESAGSASADTTRPEASTSSAAPGPAELRAS